MAGSSPLSTLEGVQKVLLNIPGAREGETYRVVVPNLEYNTTYYYSVFAKSVMNVFSECSEVKSVFVKENLPPYMDAELEDMCTDRPGTFTKVSLNNYFKDPEGKALTFKASSGNEEVVGTEIEGSTLILYPHKYGSATIEVTAADRLSTISHSFTATVRDASVPIDVYPNPVIDKMYLRTGTKCSAVVKVISNTGTIHIDKRLDLKASGTYIDLGNLKSGVYEVKINIDGGKSFSRNIVKL